MKLSEKIAEYERLGGLVLQRSSAAERVKALDEGGECTVAVDLRSYSFKKGHPIFEAVRSELVSRVVAVDEQLMLVGIDVDLAPDVPAVLPIIADEQDEEEEPYR